MLQFEFKTLDFSISILVIVELRLVLLKICLEILHFSLLNIYNFVLVLLIKI